MIELHKLDYESPIGLLEIVSTNNAVASIMFCDRKLQENHLHDGTPEILKDCVQQLDEYFKGKRKMFTFAIALEGTDFQKNVWNTLSTITFGETCTYKNIAERIGNEKAIRAVGHANGKNKLSIVIPCHRIIGTNGKLTGYAGGLWRKEWLLQHEKSFK